ncbi:unnamed protein product [Leuciscus chuanchicus]
MADHGIRVSDSYSTVEDRELDVTVREILSGHPNTGYKMMLGHLRARGIRVQRRRVKESMHRVDPRGVMMHTLRLQTRRRRQYSVPAPNSLWHIDGNHKLIRHFLQLFRGDTEAFPGQPGDIVSPACPRSSPGSPPSGMRPEHLPGKASRRHPEQMPDPPQLTPLHVEEQRLYSELLPSDRASHPK